MARRVLVSYLALTLVVLVVLEVPLALGERRRLETELTAELTRDAFSIAQYSEETLEGRESVDLDRLVGGYLDRTGARAVIVDRSGRARADSGQPGGGDRVPNEDFSNRAEIRDALAGRVSSGFRYSETMGSDLLYVAVPVASGDVFGAVRLSFSTGQIESRLRRYWLGLGAVAVASLAAAAIVGLILARWVGRPLDDLADAARQLGNGDLGARAATDTGPPEVRRLATSFNTTAARLQDLVRAQDEFVADASHQLRTPLTAQRLRLENLRDDLESSEPALAAAGLDPSAARDDLDAALAEGARLARLVDGLLALARANPSAVPTDARPLDVAELLAERGAAWEPLAAEHGVALVVVAPSGIPRVRAGEDRVTQVVDNLIANALDAVGPGGRVELRAEEAPGEVALHVLDDGPGLSAAARAHAFDRFWRGSGPGDGDRAPGGGATRLGGSGLGLAIVRKLVATDGGVAELAASDGGGVDAVVRYPTAGGADPDP